MYWLHVIIHWLCISAGITTTTRKTTTQLLIFSLLTFLTFPTPLIVWRDLLVVIVLFVLLVSLILLVLLIRSLQFLIQLVGQFPIWNETTMWPLINNIWVVTKTIPFWLSNNIFLNLGKTTNWKTQNNNIHEKLKFVKTSI